MMAWIQELGLNRDRVNRFLIVISIRGRDKIPLRVVAEDELTATIIADELEEEKRVKKLELLRQSADGMLSSSDVSNIKQHLKQCSLKHSKELQRKCV